MGARPWVPEDRALMSPEQGGRVMTEGVRRQSKERKRRHRGRLARRGN